jgi:hypothetical protein
MNGATHSTTARPFRPKGKMCEIQQGRDVRGLVESRTSRWDPMHGYDAGNGGHMWSCWSGPAETAPMGHSLKQKSVSIQSRNRCQAEIGVNSKQKSVSIHIFPFRLAAAVVGGARRGRSRCGFHSLIRFEPGSRAVGCRAESARVGSRRVGSGRPGLGVLASPHGSLGSAHGNSTRSDRRPERSRRPIRPGPVSGRKARPTTDRARRSSGPSLRSSPHPGSRGPRTARASRASARGPRGRRERNGNPGRSIPTPWVLASRTVNPLIAVAIDAE